MCSSACPTPSVRSQCSPNSPAGNPEDDTHSLTHHTNVLTHSLTPWKKTYMIGLCVPLSKPCREREEHSGGVNDYPTYS